MRSTLELCYRPLYVQFEFDALPRIILPPARSMVCKHTGTFFLQPPVLSICLCVLVEQNTFMYHNTTEPLFSKGVACYCVRATATLLH